MPRAKHQQPPQSSNQQQSNETATINKSNILFYCGNGGILPNQITGDLGNFFIMKGLYESLGYSVDYTWSWPSSLEHYRIIFLLLPGFNGNVEQNFFSPIQLFKIQTLLKKGGRVVIIGENGSIAGQAIINNLLLRIPCRLSINKSIGVEEALTSITNHRFMKGIKVINVSGYASLTARGHARALTVDSHGKPVIAFERLGRYTNGGEVILCGDSNILDDDSINKPDNQLFAINLLQ